MEVHGGAEIHLQLVKDPTLEQVDAQTRLWPCGKPMLEQAPVRTCVSKEREAHTGTGLLGPQSGAGEEYEEPFPEEDGVSEITCDELTITPIRHHPPQLLLGEEVEFRSEAWEEGRVEELSDRVPLVGTGVQPGSTHHNIVFHDV
ncbi:hypothetical protein BTVI_136560 [Pitangus sulphuratus]|nr:hypothetical protein BTVI_136560 [Pitangus sulphuratus]